jgi:hypothetical protein
MLKIFNKNNLLIFFIFIDFSDSSNKARGYVQHGIYQNVNK